MAQMLCGGPASRREFLRFGALALGGLTLPEICAARALSGKPPTPETSVIMLYTHGGASQLETYDLKPDAPTSFRGVFRPIATNVPGISITEKFPLQAKIADKFSLVRSLHHDVGIHSDGGIIVLTGKRPTRLDPTSTSKSEHPDFGSITSKIRGMSRNAIPPYISLISSPYMTRPTYLGLHHAPFEVKNVASANFMSPYVTTSGGSVQRSMDERRRLLEQMDRLPSSIDPAGQLGAVSEFRGLAFDMLTNPKASQAFDLRGEEKKVRDHYGNNRWGEACLMARRLAEAGSGVINIYFNTPKDGPEFTNWDDHIGNAGRPGHFGKFMETRLPYMDQALTALIEDIFQRGLDKKVLIVVVGEFGRTPRISQNSSGTGRDHWPQAYTALVSGGGLRMGQVVGATNSRAEYPQERPYTPQDLLATIYRHLGIDDKLTFPDHGGRPIYILEDGKPIPELI